MIISDVFVLTEVEADLDAGKQFYDAAQMGVGKYFQDGLIADMASLIIYAGVHKSEHGFHRMFAKRFPYAIYYYVENQAAYVVAVLPIRRNPLWIQNKLKQRS